MGRRARQAILWAAGFALCTGAGHAQTLSLPQSARLTHESARNPGSYALPTGVWTLDAGLPVARIEGPVTLRSYRVDGSGLTPLQIIAPLRDQLVNAGFDIVLDCAARECGGFDFRFATEVLPTPDMYVDLSAFRFVSARNADGAAIGLLTSTDRDAGYIQIIQAGVAAQISQTAAAPRAQSAPASPGTLAATLETEGRVVLGDLVFATGSAALEDGPVASLDALAAYLQSDRARRIVFVGHTDAVGSLEGNQALSRRRAQAAVTYLQSRHGLAAPQISADGVGYLAPLASNLTEQGRTANRRVEAVLLDTR